MVLSMNRWKGKVAVVVGASSGIGAEIVKYLLNHEIIVVGLARKKDLIQQLSTSKNLHSLKVDIRNEEELISALGSINNTLGPIHILINSAGTFYTTSTIYGDNAYWRDTFDTDVFGLLTATREVIQQMIANDVDGHIVHISGLCGHGVYVPKAGALMASKAAITTMTETLRKELSEMNSKIKVSNIAPAVVSTEIHSKNASVQPELLNIGSYIQSGPKLNVSDIADAIIYILSTPPHVQVHSLQIRPVGSPF